MTASRTQATVTITRKASHDLMNHLCVALGNSELLLMELSADDPPHAAAREVMDACTSAIALVQGWSPPEGASR